MKPAPFAYAVPSTVDAAVGVLAEHGDDAKILAGGQSLIPLLNMRLAKPAMLVDVNNLPGLDYIEARDGEVAIGALTRHRSVERSETLAQACPVLSEAASHLGEVQVRNRGTFGGSIAHADPAAQFCAVVFTLGGRIVAQSADGQRQIAGEDFFVGPLLTALRPDEMIVEVRIPRLSTNTWSFRSVTRRHGDMAVAGALVTLDFDEFGVCCDARIGLYAVGSTPSRARAAESLLKGNRLDDALVVAAAEQAAKESEAIEDVHGSAEYRRELIKRLVAWNIGNAVAKGRM